MKEKEEQRLIELKKIEKEIYDSGAEFICGIDEAGRGPLAGPVVIAAAIMPKDSMIEGVNDSKKVSEKIAKDGLIVPARIDVANECIKNSIPHEKIFITMLKNTKPTPVNKNYNKINDIIIEKTESVLSGEKRAEEVFDKKTWVKLEGLL